MVTDFAAAVEADCGLGHGFLRQRHGHKTPDQIRAEQKGLETDAATEFKLAEYPAQLALSIPFPGTVRRAEHGIAKSAQIECLKPYRRE